MVLIRDANLGLLNYLLMILIFVYIVIYQVFYNLGYIKFQTPAQTVRLSLQQPTVKMCNPLTDESCHDDYPNTGSLAYCCADGCTEVEDIHGAGCNCPGTPEVMSYRCEYLDGTRASTVTGNSILVQTRFTEYVQNRSYENCDDKHCKDRWENNGQPKSRFVAGVENFTMAIDHTVLQQDLQIFKTNQQMKGWLFVDGTGHLQQELCAERPDAVDHYIRGKPTNKAPCYLEPRSTPGEKTDRFYLFTLLRAMNISLDDSSVISESQTRRAEGFTTMIKVEYFNTEKLWGVLPNGQVSYIYKLLPVPNDHYQSTDVVWTSFPNERSQMVNYGILFSVVPDGQVGVLDFQHLLVTFATSIALLTFSSIAMKHLSTKLLEKKDYYRPYLIEHSVDFHDIKALEGLRDEELDTLLKKRDLPVKGVRKDKILRLTNDGWTLAHHMEDDL